MAWESKISGTFGSVDKEFAGHLEDIKRAQKLLMQAFAEGVGWTEYVNTIEQWLRDHVTDAQLNEELIKEQMANVKSLARYFG